MNPFSDPSLWLPLVFAGLMGVSILIYVVLDGFDLGVGILFPFADEKEKDKMVASIGPFWDANETWLVLAVGLLLVAFPAAHGAILTALYLPVAIMLLGLILRGVAFEFRAKAPKNQKPKWDKAFWFGSLLTALTQGYMLGAYIMGLQFTLLSVAFSVLTAFCLAAGYGFLGATWLMIKTEGALQAKAIAWARRGFWGVVTGIIAVSIVSPLFSTRIYEKWFSWPEVMLLAPLPIFTGILFIGIWLALRFLPDSHDRWTWIPFVGATLVFVLAFFGLAYSFYPYVVPEQLTIYEAASAPESLVIMLFGALFVLPCILGYTALSYIVFRGKATELSYS